VKTRKALKIMDFRKYLNWSYTPHCATKKDIAPENPEAATVSGFFRVHF